MAGTMAKKAKALQPLAGAQAQAAAPDAHVWLSASAGTGKTHVLTARVFRLLLQGVRPENILCLTFTKAGAAEMADRVHDRRSEEHTSELQSLMRISYAVFCLKKKNKQTTT